MRVKLIQDCVAADRASWPEGVIPAGTILDNPDSFRLIDLGVAIAADDAAEQYVAERRAHEEAVAKLREANAAEAQRAAIQAEIDRLNRQLAELKKEAEQAEALGITSAIASALPAEAATDLYEEEED